MLPHSSVLVVELVASRPRVSVALPVLCGPAQGLCFVREMYIAAPWIEHLRVLHLLFCVRVLTSHFLVEGLAHARFGFGFVPGFVLGVGLHDGMVVRASIQPHRSMPFDVFGWLVHRLREVVHRCFAQDSISHFYLPKEPAVG